ncbi:hypothetical protein [Enterovirga aerilata]|uniref:Uncharacterized protein n=1 Tax=Enterovirga aerilata TaxID=2730920 RepID=A0A849I6I7_9HYPH|nr:hypothetical protein [Enterovirga sp. DB1703]NNM75092.1 hypothetical protein [Enterovirga sp. DB1703]
MTKSEMHTATLAIGQWLERHNLKGCKLVLEFEDDARAHHAQLAFDMELTKAVLPSDLSTDQKLNGIPLQFRGAPRR